MRNLMPLSIGDDMTHKQTNKQTEAASTSTTLLLMQTKQDNFLNLPRQ